MISLAPHPLVTQLERQPGEREVRYAHLLAGAPAPIIRMESRSELERRLEALEVEVRDLRIQLEELKKALGG